MLKLPTLAELIGLFFRPTRLAQATAGIERAAADASAVAKSLTAKAERSYSWANMLTDKADAAFSEGRDFDAESIRATRVAGRLSGLIA